MDNISHEEEVKELRKTEGFVLMAVYNPADIKFERELLKAQIEMFKRMRMGEHLVNNPDIEYKKHIDKCVKLVDVSIPFDSTVRELNDKIEDALDRIEAEHNVPV